MCNCHGEVGGATRAEDEGQEQTVASGPRRGWGWQVLSRPIVDVGSADGWSGLGCYIPVVGIGSYGEKKGCKNRFLGLMLPQKLSECE